MPFLVSELSQMRMESRDFLTTNGIRVVSPTVYQNNTSGILILGHRLEGFEFDDDSLSFIKAFGNTAILVFENFRLLNEVIKKKQIEKELHLALEIQQNLLPEKFSEFDEIEIYGKIIPSRFVGGNYFDILQSGNEELLFVIADVSGKGIPSELIMVNIQAGFKILSRLKISLYEIIQYLNQMVYENTSLEKFVTMFIGKLNIHTKRFSFINAGQNPPFLMRNGKEAYSLKEGRLI